MDNKEFSKELEKRTRKFAVSIIRLSAALPLLVQSCRLNQNVSVQATSPIMSFWRASLNQPEWKGSFY